MCIICNVKHEHFYLASGYLISIEKARASMKEAELFILELSRHTYKKEDGARYRKIHKQMIKARKNWNKIEMEREKED